MAGRRLAFVSRELAPFGGGGIGPYVRAASDRLAEEHDVTVFTTSRLRDAYDRARAAGADALPRARVVFVGEPRPWDARRSYSRLHAWSAAAYSALIAEYGARGPDLVEFPDFLGEGCVTVQARRTASAPLAGTTVCVRAYGTAEMYDVLDGYVPDEQERAFTYELERYALRYADAFVWPGGDVLGTYRRFYGEAEVAPDVLVRHPFAWESGAAEPAGAAGDGPLRILYLGRLERRKGVRPLLGALLGLPSTDWRLTVVGGDTETGPIGQSVRAVLEAEAAGDPRVELRDRVPRADVPTLIEAHDLICVPSLWECWPNVALEAMDRGRPVLATPTGGMVELVEHGVNGWLAPGTSEEDLRAALAPLVAEPRRARQLAGPAVRERRNTLSDEREIAAAYLELCERPGAARTGQPRRAEPLVSVVIPYFRMHAYLGDALDSVAAQTHGSVEVVIVNDGSLAREDGVVFELAERHGARVVTQPNGGLGAARNVGIAVCAGSFVLPLDPDNVLDPRFVELALAALDAEPDAAYVTSWLRYIDERGRPWKGTEEGAQPLGNSSAWVERYNVAGDATALFRREVFDRFSYSLDVAGFEDWTLYREMRRGEMLGHVIPEPLIGYRMRDDSMIRTVSSPRERWLAGAIEAHLREREVPWTAPAN